MGEGYKPGAMSMPRSWPGSALSVNLQLGRGGRISFFNLGSLFCRVHFTTMDNLCLCSLSMSFSEVVTQVCYEIIIFFPCPYKC